VTGVRTRSGWSATADAVASNGDVVHSYSLIEGSSRGPSQVRALKRKRFSPGLFVLHFGLEGTFDIAHHTILFGPRYGGLVNDIYKTGKLATDPALYLHHPTITDPSMAPAGCSTFYALAPVPNAARADVDWAVEGPKYQEVVLDTLEERLSRCCGSRPGSAPTTATTSSATFTSSAPAPIPAQVSPAWSAARRRPRD
jgi:phytoene desaturase